MLKAYAKETVRMFMDPGLDPRVKSGVAATLKSVMVLFGQGLLRELSERCGAQGLFEYNQIIEHQVRLFLPLC